jgi:hypothetical protein
MLRGRSISVSGTIEESALIAFLLKIISAIEGSGE